MAKENAFYFTHDYNVRNDSKIKKLLSKHGYLGYGLFWAIIEDLYNNANALPTDYQSIAFDLRVDESIVKSIINDFELFVFDGDSFGSLSVQKRMDERVSKSVKAKESAFKRWNKNTNAMPTQCECMKNPCECTAIKESKGKEMKVNESKENNIKDRKLKFSATLEPYLEKYGREMLNKFYFHWIELQPSGKKMKFELQKTWETGLRLATWKSNESKFNTKNNGNNQGKRPNSVGKVNTSGGFFQKGKQ